MAGMTEILKTKKKLVIVIAAALLLLIAAALILLSGDKGPLGTPTLTVETPQKLSAQSSDTFTLDVTIDHLGEALYPAASMSISFDPACLEFLGVEEGNTFIHDDESSSGRQLPDWSCNVQRSNEAGLINIMYLDMTGGSYAFSQELLAEEDNVVLRLSFRLRGSARTGDVLNLVVEDAVFAASDERESLATNNNTLRAKDSRIVIGG